MKQTKPTKNSSQKLKLSMKFEIHEAKTSNKTCFFKIENNLVQHDEEGCRDQEGVTKRSQTELNWQYAHLQVERTNQTTQHNTQKAKSFRDF